MQSTQNIQNSKASRKVFDETIVNMGINDKFKTNYLFYTHLIAQCKVIMDAKIKTAGVRFHHNVYELYVNPDFFESISLNKRAGVLKHEMQHVLNGHCLQGRRIAEKGKHKTKNIAYDCAINQFIEREDLPEGAIYPDTLEKAIKKELNQDVILEKMKESEYYYEFIRNIQEENKDKCQSGKGDGESGDGSGELGDLDTLDDHDMMESGAGSDEDYEYDEDLAKDMTRKMIEKATDLTMASSPGSVPSNIQEYLNLFKRKSEVNWKKELKKVVGTKKLNKTRTYKRPNRRQPNRMELKGTKKDFASDVLVVMDSSGSVDSSNQVILLNEIKNICESVNAPVTLIQVDTEACEPEKITKNMKLFKRKKAGGTYLSPALEKAKERRVPYNTVVICTDGGIFGDDTKAFFKESQRGINVIWLVDKTGSIMSEMTQGTQRAFLLKH